MNVTKDELLQFKEEKLKELDEARRRADNNLSSIKFQLEKYEKELEARHYHEFERPVEKIQTEIEVVDKLIVRAENKQELN